MVDKVLRPNYPATKLALSHEHEKSLAADEDPDNSDDDDKSDGRSFLSSSYFIWEFDEWISCGCLLIMD